MNSWEKWQGRLVDGLILETYLGGIGESAVFRGRREGVPGDVAVRFLAADWADAEKQLERWKKTAELSHTNLISLISMGQCAVEGGEFAYVVEEFAEENLAQIVPERALTAEEVRGMLEPVLEALAFVHGKGLVHGHIRPSNILAVGDRVKLATDSVREPGGMLRSESVYDAPEVAVHGVSAAGDVWSLGITLAEVMTQHTPPWDAARMSAAEVGEGLPEPFRGIIRRCVEIDPAKRCGLLEIRNRLEANASLEPGMSRETSENTEDMRPPEVARTVSTRSAGTIARPAAATDEQKPGRWVYAALLALVAAAGAFWMVRSHSSSATSGDQISSVQPQGSQPASQPSPSAQASEPLSEKQSKSREALSDGGKAQANQDAAKDGIVHRVLPEVSPGARRTIQGKIRVRVKVVADADGNVTDAKLKGAGPSRYFARVSLDAAKRWKFAPSSDAHREWILMFAFTRARSEASATKTRGN